MNKTINTAIKRFKTKIKDETKVMRTEVKIK